MLLKLARQGLGRIIMAIDHLTRSAQKTRSPDEQASVNEAARHLTLYQFTACPFCIMVRRAMHHLNVPIELRDAQTSPHREDLITQGGKLQTPCLRIDDNGQTTWLYESRDIIAYLEERFG